jgi:hypothetical protein
MLWVGRRFTSGTGLPHLSTGHKRNTATVPDWVADAPAGARHQMITMVYQNGRIDLGPCMQDYLRWRNANARHPDVLAAQRRERARIRQRTPATLGTPKIKAA